MIRLNITEKDLLNEDYVLDLARKLMYMRRIGFNGEGVDEKIEKCFKYYNGELPQIVYKDTNEYEPRIANLTKPLVNTATKTFIGDLPDIVASINEKEKEKTSYFSKKLYNANFGSAIYEVEHYASKCGTGFLSIFTDVGDTFPRFKEINPLFADCIYDCSLACNHIASYYIVSLNDIKGYGTLAHKVIYIYTKDRVYAFESHALSKGQPTSTQANEQSVVAYPCWVKGNGEKTHYVNHDFGDIPLIEFLNNEEMKGDCEDAFPMIDKFNNVLNDRAKNVNDIVNYILFLKNVRIGDKEEQDKFINLLKQHHILATEGEDVDARFLSNQLNQDQMETLQKTIKDIIHYITRIPDLSSVDFSQNASDPIIKIKTKPLLDLCVEKEKWFTKPYLRVIKMVLNWCEKKQVKDYNKFDFDADMVELKYTHTLPSNDNDMITMITNLANSRMANPEILLQELSFIPNVFDYIKGMDKWNEKVDKAKQENNNKNNNGVNDTNIERQNAKPLTKDNMDNKANFDKGNANTLSDNKVV